MADIILYEKGKDPLYKTWHSQKRNMILYVHEGEGSLVTREKSYPFRGGSLAFVGIDKYHYTIPSDTARYKRSKIFIERDRLLDLLKLFYSDSEVYERFSEGVVVFAESVGEEHGLCESILARLSELKPGGKLWDAELCSAALRLLILLSRHAKDSARQFKGIHRAIEYINENISAELTVEQIAVAAHLSKYHFCREFKRCVGMTVMKYITKTRVIIAEAMLKKRDMSVTDIALASGFGSGSHFSKVFKEAIGVTPLEYRKGKTSENLFEKP